jgi:hypothetical protein
MNRQKREEAIRAGLLQDKRRSEQRPGQSENQERMRGGDTADQPERPPKPQHEPRSNPLPE